MKLQIICLIITFIITAILGKIIIPILKKLKIGQVERTDGPRTHLRKQGTPTMGGIIMMLAIIIPIVIAVFCVDSSIRNSILISPDGRRVVNSYSGSLNVNYNYWGDTLDNPNQYLKPDDVEYWYASADNLTYFDGLELNNSFILVKNSERLCEKIISKDLKIYYKSNDKFKIQVYDKYGKVAFYEEVTFFINNHEYFAITDDNGFATLKIKEKPGKYVIFTQYGDAIVKNKITVKSTLIMPKMFSKQ